MPTTVPSALSGADIVWVLVSAGLVLLMTPALALFYGGLVRAKNMLNTMMMSFVALGVSLVTWVTVGYSLAFGTGSAWIGDFSMAFLDGVDLEARGTVPHLLFMAYQGTFFVITAALISGAVVERIRFGPYVAFIALWGLFVYAPVCHWVWGGGWIASLGALDFAGGAVVHVNAAAAAWVLARTLGPRTDYGRLALLPHHVPFVVLGAGLLWFGWFGFNGGSALAADRLAVLAFVNTLLAPSATIVVWMLLDTVRTGRVTAVGAATAAVVGLVAITPAAGLVSPVSALAIGAIAAAPSHFALVWRARTRLDDSLDVFAAHGVGGIVGALLVGVFADPAWNGSYDGLLHGNPSQLAVQALSIAAVFLYSATVSALIVFALRRITSIRVSPRQEAQGLDVALHGEEAYSDGEGAVLVLESSNPAPAVRAAA